MQNRPTEHNLPQPETEKQVIEIHREHKNTERQHFTKQKRKAVLQKVTKSLLTNDHHKFYNPQQKCGD